MSKTRTNYRDAVGGHWDEAGQIQFQMAKTFGLKPEHVMLDLACGSFRFGRHAILYLEPGHYTGVDGNAELLEEGRRKVLVPLGLEDRKPHLISLYLTETDINVNAVFGTRRFDFVWVHSLFDHIPPKTIQSVLNALGKVVKPEGVVYATFFHNHLGDRYVGRLRWPRNGDLQSGVTTQPNEEYWHHSIAFYEDALYGSNLAISSVIGDYDYPLRLSFLKLQPTTAFSAKPDA
jgi:SAM-dependent methyltransferase